MASYMAISCSLQMPGDDVVKPVVLAPGGHAPYGGFYGHMVRWLQGCSSWCIATAVGNARSQPPHWGNVLLLIARGCSVN